MSLFLSLSLSLFFVSAMAHDAMADETSCALNHLVMTRHHDLIVIDVVLHCAKKVKSLALGII